MKTAILVDGGFYRRRAVKLWGKKTADSRAKELVAYCNAHIDYQQKYGDYNLYRIFYYDCPPIDKTVYHPLLKKGIDFILDPMWNKIKPSLFEHIDGLNSQWGTRHDD